MLKFVTRFVLGLLSVLIIVGLPALAVVGVATSQKSVAGILTNQAVYNTGKDALTDIPLETVGADQDVNQVTSQTVDQAALNKITNRYFSYDFYRQTVDSLTKSAFKWVSGQTSQLSFNIKITDNPTQFRNFITSVLVSRYQSLPKCHHNEATRSDYNPLSAHCQDPTLSSQELKQDILNHMKGPDVRNFFQKATISSADIIDNIKPQTTADVQRAYHDARLGVELIWLALIVLAALATWLAFVRRSFTADGITILVVATVGLLFALAFRASGASAIAAALARASQHNSDQYDLFIHSLAQSAVNAITNRWLMYALIFMLIGALLWSVKRFVRPAKTNSPDTSRRPSIAAADKSTK